jgi:protein TonB
MRYLSLSFLRASLVCLAGLLLTASTLRAAGDKIDPPIPVRTIAPEAPSGFARGGVPGLVTVGFTVDLKGSVQDAAVVKTTHEILNEPALNALKKWRFKPAQKEGQPVAMHVVMPIKFDIEE